MLLFPVVTTCMFQIFSKFFSGNLYGQVVSQRRIKDKHKIIQRFYYRH